MGHGLRNRPLARWHFHSRLHSQPQGRDRGHHRRGPDRRLRAGVHERARLLDGYAADLLRVSVERTSQTSDRIGWPKNPRALAGHLRRAQTFLRALGIDIAFSREGRAGSRVIRMRTSLENTVSTVSSVSTVRDSGPEPGSEQQPWGPPRSVRDDNGRPDARPTLQVPSTAADDADGADAKATSSFGQLG